MAGAGSCFFRLSPPHSRRRARAAAAAAKAPAVDSAATWSSSALAKPPSVHAWIRPYHTRGQKKKGARQKQRTRCSTGSNQQMLHGRPLYSHLWPSRADALLPNGGNRKHTGMGGSETDSPGRGPGSGTALATRAAASQTGQLARDRCCLSPLARSARNAGTAYFISDTITI